MGVDIGICKYIPEREEKIAELTILQKLKGTRGQKAGEELDELYEKMFKEDYDSLKSPEVKQFRGSRMYNLWYKIYFNTIEVEFSFYNLYHNTRVTPDMIKNIVEDMEKLLPIFDMEERIEELLKFFRYCVENNLMIYPA